MLTKNGKEDITSSNGAGAKKRKREDLIMLVGKQTTIKRKMKKFRGRGIKTNKAY